MISNSVDRFEILSQIFVDIVCVRDLAGNIVYINGAWESCLGYTLVEIEQIPLLSLIHPDDREATRLTMVQVDGREDAIDFINRYKSKDGDYRHLQWRAVRRDDLVFGVARDVTESLALKAELVAATAAAEESARAKAEFLANISHELRTPLTSIIGFSECLARDRLSPDTTEKYVRRVHDASVALLSMINDVLDFSKLEAGQLKLDVTAFNPQGLIRSAVDMFEPQAKLKGLYRIARHHDLPERIRADELRVRQILTNLIGNALKFTAEGGVTVTAAYDRQAGRLRCEVIDTGPGVPLDRRGRLFQRFSQVDASTTRHFGGTGLGLAICRALTEAMGGEIGFEEAEGGGSCFWVSLPCEAVSAESVDSETDDGSDELVQALNGLRVLVADDNAMNRELVRILTEPFGVRVSEATDGAAAIETARTTSFDVILMDIRMPQMDGPTAAGIIRSSIGLNRRTPIVGFTADIGTEMPSSWGGLFQARLAKPIAAQQLLLALANARTQCTAGVPSRSEVAA